ncbi:helix-turn-helix domain-containing protein [Kineosporia sp. J2-2]|uniref:Helix-turn-helix domain-containing protein n=1 Tax=Kineosporia corallincola TaxID=2835133 RepID=A0ABS5TP42_9ACTN|nr:helix-turn-helix transcriptional regulator [Kineosporia corallincola]MBT0772139.1 helix-turn-helix domain-containing protein [Kineosporia corallincola]
MPQPLRDLDPDASRLARFGARLRTYRTQAGLAQSQLGRTVHVSGTLIAKMERAERRPQPDVARRLDEALGAGGELIQLANAALEFDLAERRIETRPRRLDSGLGLISADGPGISALHRLADLYDLPDDGPVRSIAELSTATDYLVHERLNSQYRQLLAGLPDLIPELTRSLMEQHEERNRQAVAGLLVQAWRAADAVAAKLGLHDLGGRLIHIMGWAAGQSGDPFNLAATSYVRAESFFLGREPGRGRVMLERAADAVKDRPTDRTDEMLAQYGALHMRAAIAAARAGQQDLAWDHLDEAKTTAAQVTEGIWAGTAFGPESVRIHEVSTAVELDAPQVALDTARDWAPPTSLPAERRSHFYVDLARAQFAIGQHDDVLETLRSAQRIAPQNVRVDPDVHSTLTALAGTSSVRAAAVEGFTREVLAPARPAPAVRAARAAPSATRPPSPPSA